MNSKIIIDPYADSSDNRILVYKFVTDYGITHENYYDNYEHGAESRYLRHMRETHIQNAAFVITRWMGEGHIGPQRFSIMENLVNLVANSLDE